MATSIATFGWGYCSDGTIDIVITNCLTGATETRNYKTEAAAKGAVTKIGNRLIRAYLDKLDGNADPNAYMVEVI